MDLKPLNRWYMSNCRLPIERTFILMYCQRVVYSSLWWVGYAIMTLHIRLLSNHNKLNLLWIYTYIMYKLTLFIPNIKAYGWFVNVMFVFVSSFMFRIKDCQKRLQVGTFMLSNENQRRTFKSQAFGLWWR